MRKSIFFIITIFVSFSSVFAQLSSVNKAKALKLKDKILIVAFEEENEAIIKKNKLEGADLKRYKEQIEGRNYALKIAFEKYWKYNTSIKYMPYSKALELVGKEKNKYVIARYDVPADPTFPIKKTQNGVQIGWFKDDNNNLLYNYYTRQTYAVNKPLKLTFEAPKEIMFVYLSNFFPAKADLIYAVKTMQFACNFMLISEKNNMSMLKNKKLDAKNEELKQMTLYVDKGDCNPPMTEIQTQSLYPYPLKAVFFSNIEEAWEGNDEKIAIMVPFIYLKGKGKEAQKLRANAIVNSSTGKIHCIDCLKFKFGEYEDPINEKSFEEYKNQ